MIKLFFKLSTSNILKFKVDKESILVMTSNIIDDGRFLKVEVSMLLSIYTRALTPVDPSDK